MHNFNDLLLEFHREHVLIMPTETVYGLASLPENRVKLDSVKQQPSGKSIAYAYANVEDVLQLTDDLYVELCIRSLLPGPFTLLFIAKNGERIGVRVPDHPLAKQILEEIGVPILLTSANIHGQKPAFNFADARSSFPQVPGIDGGPTKYQRPSAIIDLSKVRQ